MMLVLLNQGLVKYCSWFDFEKLATQLYSNYTNSLDRWKIKTSFKQKDIILNTAEVSNSALLSR